MDSFNHVFWTLFLKIGFKLKNKSKFLKISLKKHGQTSLTYD